MTIAQIISLLEATSLSDTPDLEHTIESVCGSDMMSDVLAFIVCLVFVRGKQPQQEMLQMAENLGITVLTTEHTMFDACGILYHAGLRGGSRNDA